MSETSDIYKYTQERQQRQVKARLQEFEHFAEQDRIKSRCSHLDANGHWALNVVHNFPDRMPRGLCIRCTIVIHPTHFESGGPDEVISVASHILYPVIQALDLRDHYLAVLRDAETAAVDFNLAASPPEY